MTLPIILAVMLTPVATPVYQPPTRVAAPRAMISSPLVWHTDYGTAVRLARQQQRRLLLYFRDPKSNATCREFESETLNDPHVARLMAEFVLLRLPLTATVTIDTSEQVLVKHASLSEMHGRAGVAIIDYTQPASPDYGYVVSQLPFQPKKYFQRAEFHGAKSLATLLDLPSGSLTQRTMIYAVRMQHEEPLSTTGRLSKDLMRAARKHSEHQAAIELQGHHGWDERFRTINARLDDELVPVEVCAESWPDENLVEAAVECVYSWRRSAGHWNAVAAYHPAYGYDIRRGKNGIWYATGIFAKRR